MPIRVRVETLDGAVLYEGTNCKMVRADRGAQLCVKLADEAVMMLISPRRDCVVIGQGNRRYIAAFNRLETDGTCILDLHSSSDSPGPASR